VAKSVFKDPYVVLNGSNISAYVREIEMPASADVVDSTTAGASGKGKLQGLRDEKLNVKFAQDVAAGALDSILWPLYTAGAPVSIEVRQTSAAVSTSNPKWTGNVLVPNYTPIGGSIGDLAEAPAVFEVDGVLTRATS